MPRFIKNGKNLYLRIPTEVVKAHGLQQGQEMLVNSDRISGKIILEKIS